VAQVKGLRGLNFFKEEADLIRKLAQALMNIAASDDHATRMITYWKHHESRAPQIADLYELATVVPPVEIFPELCAVCEGRVWIFIEEREQTYTRRCKCLRGRALLEIDAYYRRLEGRRRPPAA
jgi:hypothetical protein